VIVDTCDSRLAEMKLTTGITSLGKYPLISNCLLVPTVVVVLNVLVVMLVVLNILVIVAAGFTGTSLSIPYI
jgi:hypothetical protein